MNRARIFALAGFAMFALAALAGWVLMASLPGADGLHLTVDGETWEMTGGSGFWPADLLVGFIGVLVAGLVVLVVVPLSLLIALGTPLLVLSLLLAGALLVLGLVALVALSPLLLIVGVIWWIARARRNAPSTTIAA